MRRPRPVLTASAIAGAVTSVSALAAWLGYSEVAANLSTHATIIGSLVVTALGYLPHHVSAKVAERKVTPTADPRDDDGNTLTTVGDIVAPVDGDASDIVSPYAAKHAA